ncbi:uncharacterized protein [Bos indicus]|uniref:Uncharacterized protein n=1 Tax=Bos indicus TaxID=9915 RepID=A0ABM4QSM7_BOSIN
MERVSRGIVKFEIPSSQRRICAIRDGLNCDFKKNPSGPRSSEQKKPNCQAEGTPASRRQSSPALGVSLRRRAPLPESGRIQLAPFPRVGGNGSHKAPPARMPSGLSAGRHGARAPPAKPHPSSTGREENKQQPPQGSGRTRRSWSCLGFPNCKLPATETTLLAVRSLQAPRPGSRGARRWERLPRDTARPRPVPPASPIGPKSTNRDL